MRFPRARLLRCWRRSLSAFITALLLATAGVAVTAAISRADEGEPVLHHVKYSIWADTPVNAEIYYRDTDPPTFADYSHNPYQYSPNVEADVGPDKQWVLDVMLADPNQWAMVVGTKTRAETNSGFHCVLAVDGAVVVVNNGLKGALCSIRHW
jgi:cytochrome c1